MNNLKKTTSFKFDAEFISAVRYYLADDLDLIRHRVKMLSFQFRDDDLCHIEDSLTYNSFKRDILAIVAKEQRHYIKGMKEDFFPYLLDACAMNVATRIFSYIDSWWNGGATVAG